MGKIREILNRIIFWTRRGFLYLKETCIKARSFILEKFPLPQEVKNHPYYQKIKPCLDKIADHYRRHKKLFWILMAILAAIYILPHIYTMIFGGQADGTYPVQVVLAKQETIPMYLDYVGTLESVRLVDIRARVEGFLVEQRFVEGADVKEGDVLFVIDRSQYQAAIDQAIGQLEKDRAALAFASEQVVRYEKLLEKDYVSREQFDSIKSQAEEAAAMVQADEAAVEQARLNLGYCTMFAPFDGRVGRRLVDVGNLVGAAGQDTKLTTLVELDPIYAYFSPSESDYRKITKYSQGRDLQVKLIFDDGSEHPHEGKLNFMNNVVDSGTSTITMRATIPNPDHSLLPGIYTNVRVRLTEIPNVILVPEETIGGDDQLGKYVMVVDKNDRAEHRKIVTGEKHGPYRQITSGLEADEKVIIKGLQFAKPGMPVKATVINYDQEAGSGSNGSDKGMTK